jgi:cephalosporin hydroxylase
MQHGMVITIDNMRWVGLAPHPRVMYVTGSSVDRKIVEQVKDLAGSFRNRMVILDSDHSKAHVLKELDFYGDLVTPRQYLIVEDTNIHGHPVRTDLPAGPWEALERWLPEHPEFVRDETCERLLLTFNPGGYLRRMR